MEALCIKHWENAATICMLLECGKFFKTCIAILHKIGPKCFLIQCEVKSHKNCHAIFHLQWFECVYDFMFQCMQLKCDQTQIYKFCCVCLFCNVKLKNWTMWIIIRAFEGKQNSLIALHAKMHSDGEMQVISWTNLCKNHRTNFKACMRSTRILRIRNLSSGLDWWSCWIWFIDKGHIVSWVNFAAAFAIYAMPSALTKCDHQGLIFWLLEKFVWFQFELHVPGNGDYFSVAFHVFWTILAVLVCWNCQQSQQISLAVLEAIWEIASLPIAKVISCMFFKFMEKFEF